MLDSHIHIMGSEPAPAVLMGRLDAAGMRGGVVISRPPMAFAAVAPSAPAEARLDELFAWTAGQPFYPFFWIDPLEADAVAQVEMAVARGVDGFKVICHAFDPGDPRAMPVYRAIADHGKPLLFHSGILWDGQPSSRHNRPANFEELLEVDGLRFALAHASWPWYDECIAVYGKFLNAHTRRGELSVEMFIDLTPGTPVIYRREVLTKLLTVGYDVQQNLLFGTDCIAHDYNTAWTREWIERDTGIYRELGVSAGTVEDIFGNNLLRFLGKAPARRARQPLRPAE